MKPEYKKRMPGGMVYSFLFAAPDCGAAALAVIFCGMTVRAVCMNRAFDYSGAPAIAVVKRSPRAEITGIGCRGREYASFSKTLPLN